ncbi:hypothetical protein [Pedobacter sp. JY14-1]|uniref:hypothetical protein n=1 Tax=Pedobacter sp. JY14-1 TaxID=3034151 RepID=UPI0023E2EA84|nr:hypothetical protein [Pedobacter sp. JY14-1]
MKYQILTATVFTILTLQTACTKDATKPDLAPVVNVKPTGTPLKSTNWSNSAKEEFTYNSDGSLKKTIGGLQNAGGHIRKFSYQNSVLIDITKDDIKKNKFSYNTAGQISNIEEVVINDEHHGSRLDFDYNATGTLKSMKYLQFDEFKSNLVATSTYEYDGQGMLTKAAITYPAQPNRKIEYYFSDYSVELQFLPWAVLDFWHLVQPDYTFFNYPLLSRLNKLPKKIITKLIVNGTLQETKTKAFNYTIDNRQLQKIEYVTDGVEVIFNY